MGRLERDTSMLGPYTVNYGLRAYTEVCPSVMGTHKHTHT